MQNGGPVASGDNVKTTAGLVRSKPPISRPFQLTTCDPQQNGEIVLDCHQFSESLARTSLPERRPPVRKLITVLGVEGSLGLVFTFATSAIHWSARYSHSDTASNNNE